MEQEQIYHRQQDINLTMPMVASVVGCGGTGFWTALFLAMSGVREIILIDHDRVERSNLNRLPLNGNVGMNKADATYNFISRLRAETRIEVHGLKIDANTCNVLRGTVFCCTDNLTSQQVICAYCRKNNLQYQRIGYDGNILNVSRGFPLTFDKVEERAGYTFDPSWVVPAALAASAGVSSQLYKEICLTDDVGTLVNKDCSSIPKVLIDRLTTDKCEHGCSYHGNTGHCESCEYSGNTGYCEDCDAVNPSDVYDDIVDDIENNHMSNSLEQAVREWGIQNLTAEEVTANEA